MTTRSDVPDYLKDDDGAYALFLETARRFFDREAPPEAVARWRNVGVVPREVWRAAGEAGLLGPSVAAEYGGGGGDFGHEALLAREVGRRNLEGWSLSVHNGIVIPYIVEYAAEAQKAKWLPKLCSGEWIAAIAMTEPHAGSDVQRIRTSARRDGDHYVINGQKVFINGQKVFISNGQNADLIVLAAKTDAAAGSRGVSLIVVETAGLAGFRRGRNLEKIGNEMSDTSELFFDDMRVPAANLLGDTEGRGFAQLMNQLPQERLIVALLCQGAIERAVDLTTQYVKDRTAFGQRIIDFQNTQFKLAEAKTAGTVCGVFVDHCCAEHLRGALTTELAAMVKLHSTELACSIIDDCLQLFGGYGYMTEYPIAQMYKDVRVRRILGGTSEIMKVIIARGL
jgi:acyl-CoA dehydrogenase